VRRYIWPFFESEPGSGTGGLLDALKFDLASDAFATLRELLTKHKHIAKEFLETRYVDLFGDPEHDAPPPPLPGAASQGAETPAQGPVITAQNRCRLYDALLRSTNYVTRRQSLKLLGELLLDRNNFSVMMKYISSKQNLKQMMILLRDESKSIQFEAFHVFKVFVANPRKPDAIVGTLVRNQALLIQYLEAFHPEKQEPQFLEEKNLIIETIRGLQPPGGSSVERLGVAWSHNLTLCVCPAQPETQRCGAGALSQQPRAALCMLEVKGGRGDRRRQNLVPSHATAAAATARRRCSRCRC
jgi:hypothetical protein